MQLEFSRQILENSHVRFCENPSNGNRVLPYGRTHRRTDITKLTANLKTDKKKLLGICMLTSDPQQLALQIFSHLRISTVYHVVIADL